MCSRLVFTNPAKSFHGNFQPHFPYFNDLKQLNVGLTLRRDLEMKDDTMAAGARMMSGKAELRTVLAM
jgi:hypothetical protein